MIRLTRRYRFSASHRLHSDALTSEQNQEAYGKCNNPHGHGHNYLLEVTVAGEIDPRSGQLVTVSQLDDLVNQCVLAGLDHRDLNTEVPEFASAVPTSENLAVVVADRLRSNWNGRIGAARLHGVRLHETKRNRFDLEAE